MSLFPDDGDHYWSRFELIDTQFLPTRLRVEHALKTWPNWGSIFEDVLINALGGGAVQPEEVMRRVMLSIGGFESLPKVVTIMSARRVEPSSEGPSTSSLSGRGLIDELAAIQNPAYDKWTESRPRWAAINDFVRTILGDSNASLSIPHDRATIQIETPDRVLPLSSLGSGVEQVIVLAAAATVTVKSLVCVEEPETNLHPLLQKKLIRYLSENTDNQYIVATHSSHLLDYARATAYHVRLTTHGSSARLARRPHELIEICNDLGYRPSDLLQANCVIWVEGLSDRILVRRWLELFASDLSEGIDYSIMFYGGRLLSHLTTSEDALEDFISLRKLNRASAVIIDFDKNKSRANVNKTKRRIRDEFQSDKPAPGLAWITKCYTIENYIPDDLLKQAVEEVHPRTSYTPVGQWDNPLPSTSSGPTFDKVGIADAVASMLKEKHLNRFDLRNRIQALADFVRASNGLTTGPQP